MSAEIVTIVAGQNLYKKGDPPSNCFILQKGSVHILNESGQKVAGVSPNMLFGEIEIFAGFKERETEAVCVTSGAAVSVPAEVLNNKLASLNKSQANLLIEVAKNAIKKRSPVPSGKTCWNESELSFFTKAIVTAKILLIAREMIIILINLSNN